MGFRQGSKTRDQRRGGRGKNGDGGNRAKKRLLQPSGREVAMGRGDRKPEGHFGAIPKAGWR